MPKAEIRFPKKKKISLFFKSSLIDLINGKISIMDNSKKLIIIGQTEFFPISFIYLIGIQ